MQWRVKNPMESCLPASVGGRGDRVGGGRESNGGTVARFKRGEGWGRGIQ